MQNILNSIGEGLRTLVRASGWRDVIDILIIAYIIYQLMTLVRRTRAAQLLRGIVILLVCYFLSRELELKTVNFLLENVLSFGLLALVVVFQPELRRALEQMGRSRIPILSFFTARDSSANSARWSEVAKQISDSCEHMSRERTGALIVIEREAVLDEVIRTGTGLDAEVTSELLETIFYKGSPLHDGAVIIRDARIVAAGCLLPVSQRSNISRGMGTRHRAAIGMSENADAMIIVVSEETGTISITKDGAIRRHFDRAGLFRELQNELVPADGEQDRKNLMERLFSK
ncbi:MAG: diadenylate cyclase CdaA [Oscillospiraceae bacterium]|nr:diadenylate cyclase CdaA [Oscillospiraceae bacterium]